MNIVQRENDGVERCLTVLIGIVTFIISWIAYLFFSDKKKFHLYVLTAYIGIILALITDLLMFVYPLWNYPGTKLEKFFIQLLNGFGLYFVVIYLFLQFLPKRQTVLTITRYIFFWSMFAIILEFIYLHIGFIEHGLWWNIMHSYIADLLLFVIFYLHHKWASKYSLANI
ncbi:CBO0543 family protein [Ureibacillus aquaedulcis]|uniref:CBO0543 family protein n=1 Tax=Ureibacillus aquaedulcis TaxID=3058421 RepID=A0ABT8GTH8_9BACL|nr:CBO0543 family protein [Ureibacillus sp. BA0131]MDN4494708.1 CBO0543 family protein [Ureibacillus sp. BA0131]